MTAVSLRAGRFRTLGSAGVAAALVTCGTACHAGQRYMEAPVLADCGQQIGNSSIETEANFVPGGVIEPDSVIELVGNCDVGANVTVSANFRVMGAITARDGTYQAVAVSSKNGAPGPNGILTVSQHGHRLGQMTILGRWVPPTGALTKFCDPLDTHNYGTLPKNYCPPGWKLG